MSKMTIGELRSKIGHARISAIGACLIILDSNGHILMIRRKEGNYGLPGGVKEMDETFEECVIRETFEEVGLTIQPQDLTLLGVLGGKAFYYEYPNGDQIESCGAIYIARCPTDQVPQVDDDEATDYSYHSIDTLPENIRNFEEAALERYRMYISAI